MSVTLVAEDPAMVVMMCEGFRVLTLWTDHVAGHTAGYRSCINNQGHVRVHSLVKTDLTKLYFGQPLSVEQRANPVTSFGQSRDLFRSNRDYCTKDGSFGFWWLISSSPNGWVNCPRFESGRVTDGLIERQNSPWSKNVNLCRHLFNTPLKKFKLCISLHFSL